MINFIVQLAFDILIGLTLGWHLVFYLIFSTLIVMGLHPMAGHFISEHYIMFSEDIKFDKNDTIIEGVNASNGQSLIPETRSYYGPLNWLSFNVGYHVEHHDFPSVPATKLPMIRKIAPEFYNIYHHTSWIKVIYQYITDPKVGPYARIKRKNFQSRNY